MAAAGHSYAIRGGHVSHRRQLLGSEDFIVFSGSRYLRRIFYLQFLTLVLLAAKCSDGQENPCKQYSRYSYDVASISPMRDSDLRGGWRRLPGEGFVSTGLPIVGFISTAFDIPSNRIISLPSWAFNTRFQIEAKMDNGEDTPVLPSDKPSASLYQLRLKALLCERFSLRAHSEMRVLKAFKLVTSGSQSKLKVSTSLESSAERGPSSITLTGATMGMIASTLSNLIQAPVIDETGIGGKFDITLDLGSGPAGEDGGEVGSIFTVLKDENGLKLIPAKEPLPVLIIDALEKPTPN